MAISNRIYATGRRKEATARVMLTPGNGAIQINGRDVDEYMRRATLRMVLSQPLELTQTLNAFDVRVNVRGGGLSGQAGAIRHGISRALLKASAEHRSPLKRAGMLTRDAREVERKKYGQSGARRRFQFSKR